MSDGIRKSREVQKEERRKQILECGLNMMVSRGYEATKIRDIADCLGISVGLFFNYFESKEKLYEELILLGVSGPERLITTTMGDIGAVEQFARMAEFIFNALRTDAFTAKMFLLMAETMRSEVVPESVKKLVSHFDVITPLIPVIEHGQRDGSIRKGNPTALIIAFWGAIQGIAQYAALTPQYPLPESEWIVDILRSRG